MVYRRFLYKIGNTEIELPREHRLEEYQRVHPNYDRFLPHLARHLNKHSVVLDIGANCGDTLAAMVWANSDLAYVCIEPDPAFYSYLLKNIERLREHYPKLDVVPLQIMIGAPAENIGLVGSGGTRSALPPVVACFRNWALMT